ncbi:MAG: sulfite exporter TauE/SafE family protein [Gammaproteobacteria bacterium]|nr:MAG: sulfite exporter TauE/SafE family protein [Gammaproteobacteria bacterium]RLA59420.1 MAG: sulfite exporter TauE/SafE family protein [Gammaproteobacteria bacterium]
MLADPWFYLASIPAVLLYGIAKGGFGGAVSILAVPMMALIMPPTQAAAILLPILVVMDVLAVRAYWGISDRRALHILLPGALVGVAIGYFTAEVMNEHYMRVLIGVISLAFGVQSLLGLQSRASREHHRLSGGLFGALTGFTSFSIHAGGPPFTMYLMPKQLSPLLFAGTAAIFFAVVNAVKLIPYYFLNQFTADNLLYSLVLVPLAPLGVKLGHFLVKRSTSSFYYSVISFFLVVVGVKLLWEGVTALTV